MGCRQSGPGRVDPGQTDGTPPINRRAREVREYRYGKPTNRSVKSSVAAVGTNLQQRDEKPGSSRETKERGQEDSSPDSDEIKVLSEDVKKVSIPPNPDIEKKCEKLKGKAAKEKQNELKVSEVKQTYKRPEGVYARRRPDITQYEEKKVISQMFPILSRSPKKMKEIKSENLVVELPERPRSSPLGAIPRTTQFRRLASSKSMRNKPTAAATSSPKSSPTLKKSSFYVTKPSLIPRSALPEWVPSVRPFSLADSDKILGIRRTVDGTVLPSIRQGIQKIGDNMRRQLPEGFKQCEGCPHHKWSMYRN